MKKEGDKMKEKIMKKLVELYDDLDLWLAVSDDPKHSLHHVADERIMLIRTKINLLKELIEGEE